MSKNHFNISNLGTEVSTQLTHDYCLMSHLALEGEFTISELRAINRCRMSKGIFFISNIRNHQGTQLQKSATDNVTSLNLIQDFNWPRKHHTNILEWNIWKKSMRNLCDKSKENLRTPLGQWCLDDNKYITSRERFLSRDHHIIYYREHETWCKYTQPPNPSRRRIEFLTDTKSRSQHHSRSQVYRIILTSITLTHLQI